jgi:hypothetical protein
MSVMITLTFLLAVMAQDDVAAKVALESFKTSYGKSKDPKSRAEAVTELAKTLHGSVANKLASLLTTDDKEVRISSATGLGTFNRPAELKQSAAKFLGQALTSGANAREVEVRVAIFAALGTLQEETSTNTVKSHFEERDAKIACAAVSAAGGIRSKTLIEPLIQVLKECERDLKPMAPPPAPPPAKGKAPSPFLPPSPAQREPDKDTKDRANALIAAADTALSNITRQEGLKTGDDWERWWIKNRSTFTVPK